MSAPDQPRGGSDAEEREAQQNLTDFFSLLFKVDRRNQSAASTEEDEQGYEKAE